MTEDILAPRPSVSPVEPIEPMSNEAVLQYTQQLRRRVADRLTQHGLPDDIKEAKLLLETLDGMDRASLAAMKIQSDEKIAGDSNITLKLIAEMENNLKGNPFRLKSGSVERPAPSIEEASGLPQLELVPGETDIGVFTEDINDFLNRVRPPKDNES